jgi:hypothetical protein
MSSNLYNTNLFGSYNNSLPQGKINSWKGNGIYAYQTGNAAKDVRPAWNKDYTNDTQGAFGKPRPIKHFRKARVLPQPIQIQSPETNQMVEIDINEQKNVRSSVLNGMVNQMNWIPGGYSITPNTPTEIGNVEKSASECINCKATTVVSNWNPITNLTEKPNPSSENKIMCCNEEYKARRRIRPASTLTTRNYYTTTNQYLQNRCSTFNQRQFNFVRGTTLTPEIVQQIIRIVAATTTTTNPKNIQQLISNAKPGSPLSYFNLYVAQCVPNGEILQATEIAIISNLMMGLFKNHLITLDEYNMLQANSNNFKTIQSFITFIEITFNEPQSTQIGLYVFAVIDSNKTLSEILEGPTNQTGLGCQRVYYKPNNPQFASQGGVSASLRTLALNVSTIDKNMVLNKREVIDKSYHIGSNSSTPFILKSKYGKQCYQKKCGFLGGNYPAYNDADPMIGV